MSHDLRDFLYQTSGWYRGRFCAVCTARPVFSVIGEVVETAIANISEIYKPVTIDKYVIMPNHIHMIIIISNHGRAMRAPTLSTIINQMKGYVSKQVGCSIWQKRFHDHIIRDDAEYKRIWQYIDENPIKWDEDCYYF
jgi:REP element-mobilizing transposase RayT